MAQIQSAYASFNFILSLDDGALLGGFSEASGLDIEMNDFDYRSRNNELVRNIPCSRKCFTITLRRGLVNATSLEDWIPQGIGGASTQRSLSIALLDEEQNVLQSWLLTGVVPMKCTGSVLVAEGDGNVAIEELVLTAQALEMSA